MCLPAGLFGYLSAQHSIPVYLLVCLSVWKKKSITVCPSVWMSGCFCLCRNSHYCIKSRLCCDVITHRLHCHLFCVKFSHRLLLLHILSSQYCMNLSGIAEGMDAARGCGTWRPALDWSTGSKESAPPSTAHHIVEQIRPVVAVSWDAAGLWWRNDVAVKTSSSTDQFLQ